MNEIQLVQNPIIKHELMKIGKSVSERLAELNLENQIATNDTIQTLKKLRAELNKEHSDYKGQFKAVKDAVLKPVNEIEPIYKSEISEKYESADTILKDKIGAFEIKIKDEKKANIIIYFEELCLSEKIDFLTFENVGLEINLSTTEKAYKEKCNEFVSKITDDINLIKSMENEAEIMAEYRTNLNASKSIQNVNDRKERERLEKERIKQIEWNRRVSEFSKLKMNFDKETNTFIFNDEIYISIDSVKDIDKSEFNTKIVELDEKIKSEKAKEIKPVVQESIKFEHTQEVVKPTIEKVKEAIKEPVIESKLEIVTASFEVKGTMPELKKLGEYMRSNNLTYKNI